MKTTEYRTKLSMLEACFLFECHYRKEMHLIPAAFYPILEMNFSYLCNYCISLFPKMSVVVYYD